MDYNAKVNFFTFIFTALLAILLICYVPEFIEDIAVNSSAYQQTKCIVVDKQIEVDNHFFGLSSTTTVYYPKLKLTYITPKQLITAWTPTSRIHEKTISDLYFVRYLQKQYGIGSEIQCWYNKNEVGKVFIEKGYHLAKALMVLLATIIYANMIYFMRFNRPKEGERRIYFMLINLSTIILVGLCFYAEFW